MSDVLSKFIDLLTSGGIAALIAAAFVYFMKAKVDTAIKADVDRKLEILKAELAVQSEHIKDILNLRMEHLPGLVEAVYRARNTARDLIEDPSSFQPDLRSRLGDLGLLVTERLYEVRALLSPELFDRLHAYKTDLQGFIFDYDTITKSRDPLRPEVVASLRSHYAQMDELLGSIVEEVQIILRVDGKQPQQ
jgi:hypothetical protein